MLHRKQKSILPAIRKVITIYSRIYVTPRLGNSRRLSLYELFFIAATEYYPKPILTTLFESCLNLNSGHIFLSSHFRFFMSCASRLLGWPIPRTPALEVVLLDGHVHGQRCFPLSPPAEQRAIKLLSIVRLAVAGSGGHYVKGLRLYLPNWIYRVFDTAFFAVPFRVV